MNKKQIVLIIILSVLLTWLANLFIGNWLMARISTLPLARQLNLFNPQAPIVINNKEVVRVNNSNDAVEVAQNSQSKISSVVYFDQGKLTTTGSAINWTSDGYFVSTDDVFLATGNVFAIITASGDLYPIEQVYPDTASNLVLIKTSARDIPVLDLAEQNDVRVGQQIVSLLNSISKDQVEFSTGYISKLSTDIAGMTHESDLISGLYKAQNISETALGQPILNLSGKLIGIWDGANQAVIPSAEIKLFANNFFNDSNIVERPSFGFSYRNLTETEAKALQTVVGAQIIAIAPGKAMATLPVKPGDVIIEFNDQKIKPDTDFDNLLKQIQPDQSVKFKASRLGVEQEYTVTAGLLK